jgi:autotransporter-associated beta strand protein
MKTKFGAGIQSPLLLAICAAYDIACSFFSRRLAALPASVFVLLAAIFSPLLAQSAQISLTASDASGSTSMNTAGKWSDGNAPSAANDYFTGPFFFRTPPNGAGITFAGHSVTLQDVSGNPGTGGQGTPFRSILYKGTGGDTITINNLTNAAGSVLNNGGSGAVTTTFTGNQWTIAGNSTILSDQGSTIIGYPLAGSSSVILTNTSGQTRTITYTGNLSGFSGRFYINSTCTVDLSAGSSNLGNPAVFTPDQFDIGTGCVVEDDAGITFNNANGGFTLAGNATIDSTSSSTIIAEPITDNGSNYNLTFAGSGTIKLSVPVTYSGGTTISGGTLQMGVANALANTASVTNNSTLDLNGLSTTINGLSGSGTVDTTATGTPTLTIGANGNSGTFSGTVNNSAGTLSLTKVGAGTETLSGGYTYNGATMVAGGTLGLVTSGSLPSPAGNLTVTNGATLTVDVSSGNSLPVNNLVLGNGTNNFSYGALAANPTTPAINAAGGISAPGSSIVINISATGLQLGTITLIKYTGTPLASIANFQVSPPPGVGATLVNNTANDSIDLQITSTASQLTWSGINGNSWDLSTPNWLNSSSALTVFQQYTNGGVVAGDGVTFDDTLQNVNSTNITLNSTFYAFPVTVNSSLPYSIAGTGGIAGPTSLALSGSGTLTLLTSNSFSGGVNIANTSLIITNDSALGVPAGPVTFNGGTLQFNGSTTNNVRAFSMPVLATIGVSTNNTVRLGGSISGAGPSFNKTDNGTLVLAGRETFTGDMFLHNGFTVIDTGGSITNSVYDDVGQNTTDAATLTLQGTGSFSTANDFNLGDLDSSIGTLNLTGSATLTANQIFVGSANAAGSTATGIVNQTSGTITEVSTGVGAFAIGGRTSTLGIGVYNMNGGTVIANAGVRVGGTGIGTLNLNGGTFNALQGINIARIAGSFGTNNLNGGTLATFNVASSTGTNAIFNFNGGTLQAAFSPATPWVSGLQQANILAGGAIIDSSNFNVSITQPLLAGSANGGLTKKGSGTLTLSGTNTFTGPITNNAGTLFLNSASTYVGAAVVNAGTLQLTTASVVQGNTAVSSGAVLSIVQLGSATMTLNNLTFNGAASGSGATLGLTPATGNNPNVALVNCGTLTLNGTNTISLAAVGVGTTALVHYTGALAGSGNITNISLPQGATGYVSNNAANTTLYAVVTSTGPGLVWTGTNSVSPNLWDIGITTNWLVNSTPTTYHQIISPGDSVIFNDNGSGIVTLNTNVAPTSMVISNNSLTYTFSGSGGISGPMSLQKLGGGTAILHLTNSSYLGNTTVSNGTLQLGLAGAISPSANLVMGSGGTLELAGVSSTVGELTGSGIIDNASGINPTLTVGSSSGGTWNGAIQDHGAGGVTLHKVGSGTWFVGGTNYLNDGQPFTDQSLISAGTVIITNGGLLSVGELQLRIGDTAGQAASVVVAGGTLSVSNNVLSVGYNSNTASSTLTVNSGTVFHGGPGGGDFAAVAESIDVGAQGAIGILTVNGGQVLNDSLLYLGDGAGASGTLQLNGGLVQASQVLGNAAPTTSAANFNGGTLQAVTNSADFIDASTLANIQTGGLILDDGGWDINLPSSLQTDPSLLGGGLTKQGVGTVYLDAGNAYTGDTVVMNGTLAGVGSISGSMVVAAAGNLGAGDAGGVGTFTIASNLTLHGNATFRIDKTGDTLQTPDEIVVNGSIAYGGILTITNITSDTSALAVGDTFQIFNEGGSGNFTSIAGSPGAGLAYSFNPASGILSVVTAPSAPTGLQFTASPVVSGTSLTISAANTGAGTYYLLSSTNVAAALNTWTPVWTNVASGSGTLTTNLSNAVNPALGRQFFILSTTDNH